MQLVAVEQAIKELARAFTLTRIRIESWQGLSAVQNLGRLGLPVELYTPTQKTNADEWPVLSQRLSGRTLVLPPHARLREELLNLVVEQGPTGVRVVDRGNVHQDHAVAVRGVVAQLAQPLSTGMLLASRLSPAPVRRGLSLVGTAQEQPAADDPRAWDYSVERGGWTTGRAGADFCS